jgi:hypothetical protein
MNKKTIVVLVTMIISVLFAVTSAANRGKPSFGPELYADAFRDH